MKTIFLLRHAKSSWSNPDLPDFDRPLNQRGIRAAPFIGEVLRSRGYRPAIVISSPAARARNTAELMIEAAGLDSIIRFNEDIYEATPQTLIRVSREIDDSYPTAMLVGHNPGMEGLIRVLSGTVESMPTAALAVIDLHVDSWTAVEPGVGQVREVIRPKEESRRVG